MSEARQNIASRTLRVALTQWHVSREVAENVGTAVDMIRAAAGDGADLVTLPENGLYLGTNAQMRAAALSVDGPEIGALRNAAREAGVNVVLGGFKRKTADGTLYNTALVIGASGEIAGGYDKIHLFDAHVGGQSFEASGVETRGDCPAIIAINGVKVGLTICYDVRFPELYRQLALAGAEVLLIPAAFTWTTGSAHWEVLLRARAIESSAYVVASATIRGESGDDAFQTYGHALAVDPWGRVLADLGDADRAFRVLELDLGKVDEVRSALPVLRGVQTAACGRSPKLIEVA
ncbi:carbon-nitrogen hydrolase family protein [Burkholderia aenigmatica]|uniref:nitrilase-related carbon-nitrogen hydrolase n=1 Tax=Burkholderia cepacia complex TaxID=87882 RepID=UPI001C22091A|nr:MULTISPECIES: nitrilase-related carbon-nitrogen hydrolase [Burkholderia cepacia complex]HDR8923036.1 carbon-nitrogen hydrolase family protein [Burkholderia vietnamiensis]MBU9445224.1 carbon-nitrogen hydrolase family protein [Burkholderia multivorans]MCA8222104.1 carbon-nitrogen hydrolase family protein [Burkholderia multivorans]UKD17556.1 carbon-nitrogen hydrolase family protein [Burkholderia aenigmatica]HDR8980658.1 carbon-nitrogen hydrolase family protein [Burkholderia vietnamiensis]